MSVPCDIRDENSITYLCCNNLRCRNAVHTVASQLGSPTGLVNVAGSLSIFCIMDRNQYRWNLHAL